MSGRLIAAVRDRLRQHCRSWLFRLRMASHQVQNAADCAVAGADTQAQNRSDRYQKRDRDHYLVQARYRLSYDACTTTPDVKKALSG